MVSLCMLAPPSRVPYCTNDFPLFTYRRRFNSKTIKGKASTVHSTKPYRGRRGTAPLILNPAARWRSVVKITPRFHM